MNPHHLEALTRAGHCADALARALREAHRLAARHLPILAILLGELLRQVAQIRERLAELHSTGASARRRIRVRTGGRAGNKCHMSMFDPVVFESHRSQRRKRSPELRSSRRSSLPSLASVGSRPHPITCHVERAWGGFPRASRGCLGVPAASTPRSCRTERGLQPAGGFASGRAGVPGTNVTCQCLTPLSSNPTEANEGNEAPSSEVPGHLRCLRCLAQDWPHFVLALVCTGH